MGGIPTQHSCTGTGQALPPSFADTGSRGGGRRVPGVQRAENMVQGVIQTAVQSLRVTDLQRSKRPLSDTMSLHDLHDVLVSVDLNLMSQVDMWSLMRSKQQGRKLL